MILLAFILSVHILGGDREILLDHYPATIKLMAEIGGVDVYQATWSLLGDSSSGSIHYRGNKATITILNPSEFFVQIVVSNGKAITTDAIKITARSNQ